MTLELQEPFIAGGRRAEDMDEDGVIDIRCTQLGTGCGFGERAVVQGAIVLGKNRRVILGETNDIGQILARGEIADMPIGPIGSGD